jgi:plastocyanin
MADVRVTADIDKDNKKVTLSPKGPVNDPHDTFLVKPGDTLTWELRDANGKAAPAPRGFEVVITFVKSPEGSLPPRPLLRDGNTLKTRGQALGSTVSDQAFKGHYRYQVDLVSPSEKISLACFWSTPGQPPERIGMGGGEDSGGPPNP